MKKITREQWKQWGKWRREGAAAKKACYRAMLTQKLPKDFVFDPAKVRLEFGGFTAPKTLDIVTAACYQVDNKTEEEKEKQA
jgi:hypothetical protein